MSFSLASGIITQSGVDANLSGLSAITGVTTITNGVQTVYSLGTNQLRINGSLTLDPEIECLMIANGKDLWVSNIFNFGVPTTVNGAIKYSRATGLRFADAGYDDFLVRNGGTFNWYGGAMCIDGGLDFQAGSNVDIKSGIIIGTSSSSGRVRQNSSNFKVNGIKLFGNIRFDIFVTPVEFNGYEAGFTTKGALQKVGSSHGGDDLPYEVYDFDAEGIDWIGSSYIGAKIEFYNMGYGGDFIVTHDSAGSFNPVSTLYKDIKLKVVDTSLANIASAKYWTKDINNGSRNASTATWRGTVPAEDFTADRIYAGSTDANGEVIAQLLTRACYGGASPLGAYNGLTIVDYRSETTDNTDVFTFKVASYAHSLNNVSPSCVGSGTITQRVVMFDDPFLTETSKANVDAYGELNTPEKFYDRAKSFLVDNYAGETTTIVSRSGNTINAGSYNVTIDATAGSAFAFDGSTITIKTTSFVGNIQGSGTFTLLNGAEVLGTFGGSTVYPWEVSNVEAGSTLQLFNITQNLEIENLVVSGTAGTKVTATGTYATSEATPGDTIRLRITCQAGLAALLPFETNGVATSAGLSLRADQEADTVYNSNNIDGSSITGISLTPDYSNIQIDLDDQVAPYEISAQAIYNYYAYLITTSQGIANFYGAITPIDRLNYRINASVVPLKLQNTGSTDVVLNGGRLYRDDNVSVIDTGAGAGTGSLMQDTGMLIQYLQPQVESALTTYGSATTADLTATETTLKKKITQAALL